MIKRPCAGCFAVMVERGYCDRCRPASARAMTERDRGTSAERGYGAAWARARRAYLAQHVACMDTYKRHPLVMMPATDVDHVRAVSGPEDPLFWDRSNWQALCHACHAYKTARVDGAFGRLKARPAPSAGG